MKLCISTIHLGRYRLEMLDENNMVLQGFEGGSAFIMIMLTRMIFEPENRQYEADQRKSSDALADETLAKMRANPSSFLPPGAKLLDIPPALQALRDAEKVLEEYPDRTIPRRDATKPSR